MTEDEAKGFVQPAALRARALLLGARLELRNWPESEVLARMPLAALERKLALVSRTARTLVDLLNAKHALRVEWYIVALIAFDILLVLYGMWRG